MEDRDRTPRVRSASCCCVKGMGLRESRSLRTRPPTRCWTVLAHGRCGISAQTTLTAYTCQPDSQCRCHRHSSTLVCLDRQSFSAYFGPVAESLGEPQVPGCGHRGRARSTRDATHVGSRPVVQERQRFRRVSRRPGCHLPGWQVARHAAVFVLAANHRADAAGRFVA